MTVPFTLQASDPSAIVTVASADDNVLVPASGVQVSGSGTDREVIITANSTTQGTTTVTIDAKGPDGEEAVQSFQLTVALPFTGQFPKLSTGDATVDSDLGYSVAISGSYAVLGTPFTGDNGTTGSAYVFEHDTSGWSLMTELKGADISAGAYFGNSVAIDGNFIVVGAPWPAGGGSGFAYVFERATSTWTEVAKLKANNAVAGDDFGWSVAISGTTVAVGAILHDGTAGVASGAAYVFQPTGTTWTQVSELTPSNAAAGDHLGSSVAISGTTIIAGANLHDGPAGTDAGTAYVFQPGGAAWTQVDELTPSDSAPYQNFGISVAVSDTSAIVGADGDTSAGPDTGAAYIFEGSPTGWADTAKLTASDATARSYFGRSVAIHGDYALVGAYNHANEQPYYYGAGAAYVYQREGAAWPQKTELKAPDPAPNSQFGWSVSLTDDYALIAFGNVYQK